MGLINANEQHKMVQTINIVVFTMVFLEWFYSPKHKDIN
jgi:hypothetical protein